MSDRPDAWLVGGLAWAATLGPLALGAAVVPLPAVADLTFIGARAVSSTAWPWNVASLFVGFSALVVGALGLLAVAEVALLETSAAVRRGRLVGRVLGVTLVALAPAAAASAALVASGVAVAQVEFAAPDEGGVGPMIRALSRVWPLALLAALLAAGGNAYGSVARVNVVRGGMSAVRAVGAVPAALRGRGPAWQLHALASAAGAAGYVAIGVALLSVLWEPIALRLESGSGFAAGEALLLVGFVAIWICLVLGGGAIHAWTTLTWARLLAPSDPLAARRSAQGREPRSTS